MAPSTRRSSGRPEELYDNAPCGYLSALPDGTIAKANGLLSARRRAEESEARATNLARTLQSTFVPPEILTVPGLDVAGAYRPAGDGSEVGDDFYDVFETGRGAWGVVLGDVCGKGASAAVVAAVLDFQGGDAGDDVAVVVLKMPPEPRPPSGGGRLDAK